MHSHIASVGVRAPAGDQLLAAVDEQRRPRKLVDQGVRGVGGHVGLVGVVGTPGDHGVEHLD